MDILTLTPMRAKIQLYLNVKNARRLNMIIAIDGNKSAGKSTIITNLKEFYKGNHNILFYKSVCCPMILLTKLYAM